MGCSSGEAMVTGKDKTETHEGDALSLVGAAALRAGWSRDLKLLETPCVVVKP